MSKSIHKKYTQSQLTKIIAREANLSPSEQVNLKQMLWFNLADDNSLRLTFNGFHFLSKLGYESYKIDIKPNVLVNKDLLNLERYYPSIYFIMGSGQKFFIFDEDQATILQLMDGNLPLYLNNIQNNLVDK